MKLEGRITIGISRDAEHNSYIEIVDNDSRTRVAEIKLTAKQLVQALGGLGHTECEITVEQSALSNIGKKMEIKTLEFKLDKQGWRDQKINAQDQVQRECPEGWKPDMYFGSRDSFFKKDDEYWARTTIRRWVEKNT